MEINQIAIEIKEMRLSKSWSQQQLAEITGLSLRTIQRIEKNGRCSHETLLTLASVFELDIENLTKHRNTENSRVLKFLNKYLLFNFLHGVGSNSIALFGLLFVLPAFYFISANVLHYYFNIPILHSLLAYIYENSTAFKIFNFVSPIIFLGGTFIAIYINFSVLFQFNFQKINNKFIGTLTFSKKIANLVILFFAFGMVFILVSYVFIENFNLI